jgi:hypothetical protein
MDAPYLSLTHALPEDKRRVRWRGDATTSAQLGLRRIGPPIQKPY